MKGREILLTGMLVALVAVILPFASHPAYADANGRIEALVPSESGSLETGGGESPLWLMQPFEGTYDTGHIERLLPSESYVSPEIGAGETNRVLLSPSRMVHDNGRIELLLPSDDQ
ncbi:MAG: hypothetical protein ABSA46_14335 [Thermodesulfovibrionales bacterium]|jgi:hypothetical protein